jgi:hypothetical protein
MRVGLFLSGLLVLTVLAGCLGPSDEPEGDPLEAFSATRDVVVVAVLDWQMNPYHWDFLAEHMPQHKDGDPSTDLPLSEDPSKWLPGFPDPSSFASYDSLDLTLTPDDPDADVSGLYEKDKEEWAKVQRSTQDEIHYRYIPGTKVIGFVSSVDDDQGGFRPSSHGVGASSVSVGNFYGTCPSCLLLYVSNPSTAVEEWVRQQDWIDVTTHSYEGSIVGGNVRDSVTDCDFPLRLEAAERGQQIFWAAGNGLANTFTAPQTTLASCQKGPEWTVTVGAVHPESEAAYTGHGKPVHVSSIGQSYPTAGGSTVTSSGFFSGTSNATPVTAGIYAEALYRLRAGLSETDRLQQDGVIMETSASCGAAAPDCALADGVLTSHELREALFLAAEHTGPYFHVSVVNEGALPVPGTEESTVWTQGYGAFMGRLGAWEQDVQRIVDIVTGEIALESDPAVRDWMVAYSWCVQQVWGEWGHGHWKPGDPVPGADPQWPMRSWMASDACPEVVGALLEAHNTVRTVQGMAPV